jgi:hypothetical protein
MKHKITAVSFLLVIFGVFFMSVFREADELSVSERRRLAQFPELSLENIMSGSFMEDFNDFAVDQAPLREEFRRVKAFFDLSVLRKLDNNGIFVHDGMVFKTDYPLNERSVLRLCGILNAVSELYLDETNDVYFSFVPDKNMFIADSGYLVLDYDEMQDLIRRNLNGMTFIDITGGLSLESYFRTDTHWRQEKLFPVAEKLAVEMGFELNHKPFTEERFDEFFGVYYGQSALNMPPDELIWLVSETTRRAVVNSAERPGFRFPVYDTSQLRAVDPYNLFLCGPAAIVTVQNPANDAGRELIIFRDSFASPLTPLLLDAYSKITLLDLRYVSPNALGQLVDFAGADVLFMYSAGLFNNSASVRGAG